METLSHSPRILVYSCGLNQSLKILTWQNSQNNEREETGGQSKLHINIPFLAAGGRISPWGSANARIYHDGD